MGTWRGRSSCDVLGALLSIPVMGAGAQKPLGSIWEVGRRGLLMGEHLSPIWVGGGFGTRWVGFWGFAIRWAVCARVAAHPLYK